MSLERRLQHAARELREVTIETPGTPHAPAPRPRPLAAVTAVAVPVLFVLSGVLVAAGAFERVAPTTTVPDVTSSAAVADDEPAEARHRSGHAVSAPTPALVEVGLIADLVRAYAAGGAASPLAAPPVHGAPVTVPGPVSLV